MSDFLATAGTVSQLTPSALLTWRASLSGHSPATQARKIAAVRTFLRHAHILGILVPPLDHLLAAPRVEPKLAERILTSDEVQALLRAAADARTRLLVRLLYATGLRISEAVALTWDDVKPHRGSSLLLVNGKGGRKRSVRLTKELHRDLCAVRPDLLQAPSQFPLPSPEPSSEFLFPGRGDQSLSPRHAARLLKALAKKAGLSPAFSPHWLRHSHASHALDAGAPIHLVQKTLGHTSIATTGRYLHARPDESSGDYLCLDSQR